MHDHVPEVSSKNLYERSLFGSVKPWHATKNFVSSALPDGG